MFYLLIHAIDIFYFSPPPATAEDSFWMSDANLSVLIQTACLALSRWSQCSRGRKRDTETKAAWKNPHAIRSWKSVQVWSFTAVGTKKKNWQGSRSEGGPQLDALCCGQPSNIAQASSLSLTERNKKKKKKVSSSWTRRSIFLLPRSGRRSSQNECRHE